MKFAKAQPEQARLKVSVYGPPGAGKTFTTLLVAEGLATRDGKRIAYVDTERGTDFYAIPSKGRTVHPKAFDFDALYTNSLADVKSAVESLDPKTHGVVVVDSISHLWDAAINAYEGKKTSQDGIPMHAWGKIKKPYKALVRYLVDSPFHIFILGRQKNLFDTGADGEIKKVGVGMRAEGETAYEPHICARMESRQDENDSARSTVYMIVEKDRTGVLAGRTIPFPSFKTFEPILSMLGDRQAMSEDPDEVAAKDGELLDAERDKQRAKEDKSAGLLADFTAQIRAADSMSSLQEVATNLKKKKRYMVEGHVDSARVLYSRRHKELSEREAPSEV